MKPLSYNEMAKIQAGGRYGRPIAPYCCHLFKQGLYLWMAGFERYAWYLMKKAKFCAYRRRLSHPCETFPRDTGDI